MRRKASAPHPDRRRRPAARECREFVQVARLLEAAGVHVPRVLEVDFDAGFMLVTDLGTEPYLGAFNERQRAPPAPCAMRSTR